MRKRDLSKGIVLLLALTIVLSTFVQSWVPVRAADELEFTVDFEEHKDSQRSKIVNIPDLFDVTSATVNNGKVVYEVYGGGNVGITVLDGVKTIAELPIITEVGFSTASAISKTTYNEVEDVVSGLLFKGWLNKADEPPTNKNGKVYQKYEGSLHNSDAYAYTVTIKYIVNKLPVVGVSSPKKDSYVTKELKVEGTVNDENIGDILGVYYSIDPDNKMEGTLKTGIKSDGSNQPFNGSIDTKTLPDDKYTLYVWGLDKNGTRPEPVEISFIVDNTPPKDPVFELDPEEDTNQSVTVGVYYPDTDIVTKEFRVDGGEWKPLEGPIVMNENGTIETKATDKAGNSTTSSQKVENIDKNKPTAPSIVVSASETVSQPITVTITPGEDKESGIKTTEYCLSGATISDWKAYDAPFTVKNIGNTEISARSIDKAGNISDTTKKVVNVKAADNGGNLGSGGGTNIPSGGDTVVTPITTQAPTPTPVVKPEGTKPAVVPKADIAVYLTSDKTTYGENETINFSINYKNKSSVNADGTRITVDIPQYTTTAESSGGTVKGSKIEWSVGSLAGGASGELKFKVKVGMLDKAEVEINSKAAISSTTLLENTDDDESLYRLMLYSNRYDKKSHQLYVKGYKGNTFKPENSITRAEVAAMLVRVLNLGEGTPDKITYKDFTKKHWAYGYIYSATKSGLFEGYTDNSFKPDDYITRAELSTALARYLKLKNIEPMSVHFSDITNHWAKNYIEEIYRVKLIEGYKDGKFLPNSQIKRCETVTIINRMLYRGPLKGADTSFTDVKKDHWAYGHIVESCMDHYYTRNTDSSETKVNKDN